MGCKGVCTKYKAAKPVGFTRYQMGQKRCSICDLFINWDSKHCPCCSFTLRVTPRCTRTRRKYVLQQVKRL